MIVSNKTKHTRLVIINTRIPRIFSRKIKYKYTNRIGNNLYRIQYCTREQAAALNITKQTLVPSLFYYLLDPYSKKISLNYIENIHILFTSLANAISPFSKYIAMIGSIQLRKSELHSTRHRETQSSVGGMTHWNRPKGKGFPHASNQKHIQPEVVRC